MMTQRIMWSSACAALITALAACASGPVPLEQLAVAKESVQRAEQAGATELTCTNQTSGTSWQIRIDYDRQTVDSNPASISDDEIAWRDKADGGNYTLDRKSGKLTVVFASSTAGHFLYHHCKLEN